MLVFSKEKTVAAIKAAGNGDYITQEMLDQMDEFDGQEAVKNDWRAVVYDDNDCYIVKSKVTGERLSCSLAECVEVADE